MTAPQIDYAPLAVLGPPHKHSFQLIDKDGNVIVGATCCWCGGALHGVCPIVDAQGKPKYRFYRCATDACFQRQWRYVVQNDTDILFIPLPNQTEVFEFIAPIVNGVIQPRPHNAHNVLLLGSRGSSKSHLLRWIGHWLAFNLPDFRILMLRRTKTELEQSQLVEVGYEARKLNAWLRSTDELEYKNGSLMYFGHAADEGDEARYLSAAYDLILVDEEVTFTRKQIVDISTSARPGPRTPANWTPMMIGGTNTVGVSAQFLRAVFDTKVVGPDVMQEYIIDDYRMFKSFLWDNPFLTSDYQRTVLAKLDPRKYKAWLYCDWDAGVDHFFGEWDQHLHGITTPTRLAPTIERFCALKWGYGTTSVTGKGCLYWIACLQDGKYICEDEFTFTEKSIKEVAAEYHRRNEIRNISVRWVIANPLVFKKGGENIAETFLRHDVFLLKANDDRVNGWMRVRAWLDKDDDDIPFFRVVVPNCPYLCSTLPALVADPLHADDILPKQEENAADAIRHAAMSRPFPTPGTRLDIPREALIGKAGGLRYATDSHAHR